MSWKKSVKRAMAPLVAAIPRRVQGTPGVILCYHGVGRRAAPEVVAVDTFRRQVDLLAKRFRVVTLGELIAEIVSGVEGVQPPVAVTFDDGYKGVLEHALPVLQDHRMHATAFVLPGLWGETAAWPSDAPPSERGLWDASDVNAWVRSGMAVGSHSSTHVDLSVAPEDIVLREVRGSKTALQSVVGQVNGFCYPWGHSSAMVRRIVADAGFHYGLAGGYVRYHGAEDVFSLGRITVDYDDTVDDLAMKLRGGYDWLDAVGRTRERVGRT